MTKQIDIRSTYFVSTIYLGYAYLARNGKVLYIELHTKSPKQNKQKH